MRTLVAVALSVFGIAGAGFGLVGVIRLAARERATPARCGPGLAPTLGRCCAPGQTTSGKRCVGEPTSCPQGMHIAESRSGCVADAQRIAYKGGTLSLGAEDWQAEGVPLPRASLVLPFSLDRTEVTVERWGHCVLAGACRAFEGAEPGAPVTGVDAKEAEKFCRFESGRLPWSDEWLFAAAGIEGRRFPWGTTGLVCRRAVFGVEEGPCATGGGPEITGSRPDGATPEGVLDLSGNVAEWTLDRDGRAVARGGSYRSVSALELKTWSLGSPPPRAPDVGFRCAHDPSAAPSR